MKLIALLVTCLASTAGAVASDLHLIPNGGMFSGPSADEYPQVLKRLLRTSVPFVQREPVLDVYTLPSWSGESLLTFEPISKGPCTRGAVASLDASLYSALENRKPQPAVTVVVGCVSSDLLCEATEVVYNALAQTRYPEIPTHGGDGVSYVYAGFVYGYGVIEGMTWSPDKGYAMYNLVELSTALKSLIRNPSDKAATDLAYASIDMLRKQVPAMKANQPFHSDAACGRAGERRR